MALATDEIYYNTADATYQPGDAPQIDAKAFVNSGRFTVYTVPLQFDFQNTLNFTNTGLMSGTVGFEFDTAFTTGPRKPAANFINARSGRIEAFEGYGFYASNTLYYPTLLTVKATNIVSEGVLAVGNAGLLRLEGKTINLSRGGLEVGSLQPSASAGVSYPPEIFAPDTAVYDYWWGTGYEPTNNFPAQDSSSIVRGVGAQLQAVSPQHYVEDNYGAGYVQVAAYPAFTSGYTNVVGGNNLTLTNADGTLTNLFVPTNIIRQAVFVGVSDTNNFSVRTKFSPSQLGGVPFQTVVTELRLANTNVVTDNGETNALYVVDKLASETNVWLSTNIDVAYTTYRPAAYEVWRSAPYEYLAGFNGNAKIDKSFVWNQSFSNRFVTNAYAGYAAYVDFLAVRPPVVPGMGPTDQPGRIEIVGDQVNLSKTRFRGMGLVSVNAKHLISSSNAVVDSPSLVYNLGSTNGLLTVQNLARESSLRMAGVVEVWSGLWTNQMALVLSNWFIDATTNYFNPVTNSIDVGIHVMILSGNFLDATQQVIVYDFVARSTNIVVNDPVTVARKLILDGESFTLNGRISLTNDLTGWFSTNIPGVRYFTNAGTINVPNQGNYGSDASQPLKAFVNRGTLNAFTHSIAADYYEDTGTINSDNNLTIVTQTGKMENGHQLTRGTFTLQASDFKLLNQSIIADGGVAIDVTNNLSDAGGGSKNTVAVKNGFALVRKPKQGDLLGTTFTSSAAKFVSVPHVWTAEDRGATAAGFKDNAAIGRLSLSVATGGELRFVKPVDALGNPLSGKYALYVDYLQLSDLIAGDPEYYLVIEPDVTVYFANSNVPVEQLDGLFEGRLVWVRSFAGPQSGTPVASRQGGTVIKTLQVNTAVLNSQSIDSDGDGLANAVDNWPFDGVAIKDIQVSGSEPMQIQLSWDGAAQTVYRVEFAHRLQPPDWQSLRTITNSATVPRTLTISDSVTGGSATNSQDRARYYRVRYDL